MIYLLNAVGLPPGGSSTVHIYTQTIHRTTQNKQYIEQHKNIGRVRAVPRLCELYPGNLPYNNPRGKGGRCIGLTLPLSRVNCLEIWEPQPLGALWGYPGQ